MVATENYRFLFYERNKKNAEFGITNDGSSSVILSVIRNAVEW